MKKEGDLKLPGRRERMKGEEGKGNSSESHVLEPKAEKSFNEEGGGWQFQIITEKSSLSK